MGVFGEVLLLVYLHLLDLSVGGFMVPIGLVSIQIGKRQFHVGVVALLHICRLLLNPRKIVVPRIGPIGYGECSIGFSESSILKALLENAPLEGVLSGDGQHE